MARIRLQPEWLLSAEEGRRRTLQEVIELLTAVEEEKNLSRACRKVGVSYRHAWGLIQRAGQALGGPLLRPVRGQGATLSVLGERIVWANKRVTARLSPLLESLTSELEAEIRQAIPDPRPAARIHASHAFAMDALRDHLLERGVPAEIRYCGSADALASLNQSNCEIAGFHTPIGELESEVLESYRKWLRPRAHVLVHFVVRRQGIVVAAGNPKRIAAVSDLTRPGVRFVNRQLGSGTRLLCDALLRREGIDSRQIAGFDNAEFTHAAVGAYIASGMADAGIAVETAARQFRLNFVPLLQERYFLACHEDALDSRLVKPVLESLRSNDFKARLSALPEIDSSACGRTVSLTDAFPQLAEKQARAKVV